MAYNVKTEVKTTTTPATKGQIENLARVKNVSVALVDNKFGGKQVLVSIGYKKKGEDEWQNKKLYLFPGEFLRLYEALGQIDTKVVEQYVTKE